MHFVDEGSNEAFVVFFADFAAKHFARGGEGDVNNFFLRILPGFLLGGGDVLIGFHPFPGGLLFGFGNNGFSRLLRLKLRLLDDSSGLIFSRLDGELFLTGRSFGDATLFLSGFEVALNRIAPCLHRFLHRLIANKENEKDENNEGEELNHKVPQAIRKDLRDELA